MINNETIYYKKYFDLHKTSKIQNNIKTWKSGNPVFFKQYIAVFHVVASNALHL